MWEYFDDIRCITIPDSNELPGFLENITKVGIKNIKINTYPRANVEEGTRNGDNSCNFLEETFNNGTKCCDVICKDLTDHHYQIIKKAYEDKKRNVLIFEDDARFELPFDNNKFQKIINWLDKNEHKWDIFFFGFISYPLFINVPINSYIVKTLQPLLGHAYVVNHRAMKHIIDNTDPNINIDENYKRMSLNKYGCYPSINYQNVGPSAYTNKYTFSKFIDFTTLNKFFNTVGFYTIPLCIIVIIIIIILLKKSKKYNLST